jgi:hypothetical protein
MANFVTNLLTIEGEGADNILETLRGENIEQLIDFNKIIPLPQELLDTQSGGRSNAAMQILELIPEELRRDADAVKAYLKDNLEIALDIDEETAKSITNYVTYGYVSWYEWCIDNWGTKWNAGGCIEQNLPNMLQFDTAWSCPVPIFITLSKMYPNNTFWVEYADEDIGQNCGKYVFKDGTIIDSYEPTTNEEALEFACELLGFDAEEIKREREDN